MSITSRAIGWTEQGLVPDGAIRAGIRRLIRERLADIDARDTVGACERAERFVQSMAQSPICLVPEKANEQHYEVPAEFYRLALGSRRKYSCCYWPQGTVLLDQAETLALEATCARANIRDGQRILALGCGWGSLTLWMAERYPNARITAVSNSHSQRAFIVSEAERRGLGNVTVITCDMNALSLQDRFDRVVSVEMFEHMRNWEQLFERVADWLMPQGLFFMHVFVHRSTPYAFEARDESDWMSRHFFSGGMMPSDDLALRFQQHLQLVRRWRWAGTHYERTANAWLANLDARRDAVLGVLTDTHGPDRASQWFNRWRIFFMACAELFGFEQGQEWWVSHYLFARRGSQVRA